MLSIDSNLLVRFAVRDDEKQAEQVIQLFEQNRIHIALTVLLECEWVLRARYGYKARDTSDFFSFLVSQSQLEIEDSGAVQTAISAHLQGMDFADALHCVRAKSTFISFDKHLIRQAKAAGMKAELLK